MRVCYVCWKFISVEHERDGCPAAKKLAEKPVDLKAPFLTAAAIPTRTGPDQCPSC